MAPANRVTPAGNNDRAGLLAQYGAVYGALGLAICFTETNDPKKGDPKKGRGGWPKTRPLPHEARGAALLTSQGQYRNPALVSRPSGLIIVENDTPEGLAVLEELALPKTVTVRTSEDWKRHYWFKSWNGQMPAKTSFRIEAGGITADENRLFLVPPSRHPTGVDYTFIVSPEDAEIAVLPENRYVELARRSAQTDADERERLEVNPNAKILPGRRRQAVFRYASQQRRWTSSEEEIVEVAMIWNRNHCSPELDEAEVRHQVKGAMRMKGEQELVKVKNSPASPNAGHAKPDVDDGWPEPLSQAAYYGLTGQVVRAIEPETQADPAAVLVQFLTAVGAACGREAGFKVESTKHGLNLYDVVVGDSATSRKGSSFAQAVAPVLAADATFTTTTGLSSGEGLIWEARDAIWKHRKAKTKDEKAQADDEGYIDELVDAGVADKRLLIVESELASVLSRMGRENSTLSPVMRQAWEGAVLKTMTKSTPATATGAHIAIVAHITADELKQKLSATETVSGFANRFLWLCARRSKSLPRGGRQIHWAGSDEVEHIRAAIRFAQIPRPDIDFNDEAGELWDQEYERLETGRTGLVASVTNRAAAQSRRLATLYAILDCSTTIQVEHLRAALEVWRFCEDSCQYLFGDRSGNPIADALMEELRKRGEHGLSRTEIRDHFDRNVSASETEGALSLLLFQGKVRREVRETGGRPEERWWAL